MQHVNVDEKILSKGNQPINLVFSRSFVELEGQLLFQGKISMLDKAKKQNIHRNINL